MSTKIPETGDRYAVKHTPILRRYGIGFGNDRIMPGEIGEVRIYPGNGWEGMELEFSRGRRCQIGTRYSSTGEWEMNAERMANFKRVK